MNDLQQRLDNFQQRFSKEIKTAIEKEDWLHEFEGIYTKELEKYNTTHDNADTALKLLIGGGMDEIEANDITSRIREVPKADYELMEKIDTQLEEYFDGFECVLSLYRKFDHLDIIGRNLQEALPKNAQKRHKKQAKNELIRIVNLKITPTNISKLIGMLTVVEEDYLFSAYHFRAPKEKVFYGYYKA
ncbi:MAG: hypothetical protein KKA51_01075 [Nanoarchaeota archaeon]|nr:hypothetical protein [Nanoarchaeota archaeon]